jgi:hypothetical protein
MKTRTIITIVIVICLIVGLYGVNMIYFSMKPAQFVLPSSTEGPAGVVVADTLARLMEHELNGPGGWLLNDQALSPGGMLDNRPNFQLGVLEVVRYSTHALRENLSRQRTTDRIDQDCDMAFTRFSNDPYRWMMPSAEKKYRGGISALDTYVENLKQGSAYFYPRSDNLIMLLEQYASLLGGATARLLNASRPESTVAGEDLSDHVPVAWSEIDDNLYYAQGVGYGLYHVFLAIAVDFEKVLRDKNSEQITREIISSLEESYFEPTIVTNGSRSGILANHSNNLRVFLDDARQKMNSLIKMLDQV